MGIDTAAQAKWAKNELLCADASVKELHAAFPASGDAVEAKRRAEQYRRALAELVATWCFEGGHSVEDCDDEPCASEAAARREAFDERRFEAAREAGVL